jgi:hypothetical protein
MRQFDVVIELPPLTGCHTHGRSLDVPAPSKMTPNRVTAAVSGGPSLSVGLGVRLYGSVFIFGCEPTGHAELCKVLKLPSGIRGFLGR